MSDDNQYANDLLQHIRIMTKSETDRIGNVIGDAIFDAWLHNPEFKEKVLSQVKKTPTFLYADIFDAMGKRLVDRLTSESIWDELNL